MTLKNTKIIFYSVASLGTASNSLITGFYTIFLLKFLTIPEISLLFVFHLIIITLTDFPTGSLVDTYGARICLSLSYFLYSLAFFGLILVTVQSGIILPLLFCVEFLFALGFAQESGTLITWVTNQWKVKGGEQDRLRELFGTANAVSLFISTIFTIIGGLLAEFTSFLITFVLCILISSFTILAASLLTSFQEEEPPKTLSYFHYLHNSIIYVKKNPQILIMVVIGSLNYSGYFLIVFLVIQPILYNQFNSILFVSLIFSFLVLFQGVSYYLGGRMEFLPDLSAALLIWLMVPILYLFLYVFFVMSVFWLFLTVLFLIFAIFGFYNPNIQQYYQKMIPNKYRASITSLRSTARSLTAILLIYPSGTLIHKTNLEISFLISFILAVISLFLLFIIWSQNRSQRKTFYNKLDKSMIKKTIQKNPSF